VDKTVTKLHQEHDEFQARSLTQSAGVSRQRRAHRHLAASVDKHRIVVKLFEMGKSFVSRSEAKRILRGLEQFTELVLDYKGISEVGQGFADGMFRVWAGQPPETSLSPTNMNAAVVFLVKRAGAIL
jgi:hypothetical protein